MSYGTFSIRRNSSLALQPLEDRLLLSGDSVVPEQEQGWVSVGTGIIDVTSNKGTEITGIDFEVGFSYKLKVSGTGTVGKKKWDSLDAEYVKRRGEWIDNADSIGWTHDYGVSYELSTSEPGDHDKLNKPNWLNQNGEDAFDEGNIYYSPSFTVEGSNQTLWMKFLDSKSKGNPGGQLLGYGDNEGGLTVEVFRETTIAEAYPQITDAYQKVADEAYATASQLGNVMSPLMLAIERADSIEAILDQININNLNASTLDIFLDVEHLANAGAATAAAAADALVNQNGLVTRIPAGVTQLLPDGTVEKIGGRFKALTQAQKTAVKWGGRAVVGAAIADWGLDVGFKILDIYTTAVSLDAVSQASASASLAYNSMQTNWNNLVIDGYLAEATIESLKYIPASVAEGEVDRIVQEVGAVSQAIVDWRAGQAQGWQDMVSLASDFQDALDELVDLMGFYQ